MNRTTEYKPNKFQSLMDRIFPDGPNPSSKNYVQRSVYDNNRNILRGMLYSDFRKLRRSATLLS